MRASKRHEFTFQKIILTVMFCLELFHGHGPVSFSNLISITTMSTMNVIYKRSSAFFHFIPWNFQCLANHLQPIINELDTDNFVKGQNSFEYDETDKAIVLNSIYSFLCCRDVLKTIEDSMTDEERERFIVQYFKKDNAWTIRLRESLPVWTT